MNVILVFTVNYFPWFINKRQNLWLGHKATCQKRVACNCSHWPAVRATLWSTWCDMLDSIQLWCSKLTATFPIALRTPSEIRRELWPPSTGTWKPLLISSIIWFCDIMKMTLRTQRCHDWKYWREWEELVVGLCVCSHANCTSTFCILSALRFPALLKMHTLAPAFSRLVF